MRLWRGTMPLLALAVLAVLAGCASQSAPRATDQEAGGPTASAPMDATSQAASPGGSAASSTVVSPKAASPVVHARMIIRSAEMKIVAADPAATLRGLSAQVEARGGYVADSKQWQEGGQAHATLTLRVPADRLNATLADIRRAALRTESENVTGEDVSQQYSDLSAQLTNLEATERELRSLLTTVRQRTQRASDVLEVFNQLTTIRGQIDETKGRLLSMSQLVELATITLEIAPDTVAQPIVENAWRPVGVVRDAFRTLVSTLKAICDVLIWVCVYILPLGALIAAGVFLIRRAVRSARSRLKRTG